MTPQENQATWKLLAALAGCQIAAGLIILAVGAAYDYSGRAPGNLALLGATLVGGPWLALAKRIHSIGQAEQRRRELAERREEHELSILRSGQHFQITREAVSRDRYRDGDET